MENELLSADEAVARLMNIDFIPAAYTLEDLLEGFVSEAQDRYDASLADPEKSALVIGHSIGLKICEQRLAMTRDLLQALRLHAGSGRLIAKDGGTSRTQNLNWQAVQEWAEENFGLVVPDSVVIIESTATSPPDEKPDAGSSTNRFDKLVGRGLSRTKSKNLLVTLYALAKTHAEKHRDLLTKKPSGALVIDAVAKEIVEMVSKLSPEQKVTGQSTEAIKDRLEAAVEAWQLVA